MRTFNENEVYLHTNMESVPALCAYFYRKQAGRLVSVFAEDERERVGAISFVTFSRWDSVPRFFLPAPFPFRRTDRSSHP